MTATIHQIDPMRDTLDRAYDEWRERRFDATITRPDRSIESFEIVAHTSIDAATLAMERGGIGSTVRVQIIEQQDNGDIVNHEFDADALAMHAARALTRPKPERKPVVLTETMVAAMDDTAGLCEPTEGANTQEKPE